MINLDTWQDLFIKCSLNFGEGKERKIRMR